MDSITPGSGGDKKLDEGRLKRRSRPVLVADAIKALVVEKGLAAGDRLPSEPEMIARFGMAKGTIREAMRLLEAQGLVETKTGPGGGSFIKQVVYDGFVIGSDPSVDYVVQEPGVQPRHGTLQADSRGYRLNITDAQGGMLGKPLSDDERFAIAGAEFVFKIASRFPVRQTAAIRLEVLDGMDQGRSVALQEGVAYTVGSHVSCDLVLRGKTVASRHAVVLRKDKKCIVADLGSESGILSGGERVGLKSLSPGDEITLGDVRLLYTLERWDENYEIDHDESTRVADS